MDYIYIGDASFYSPVTQVHTMYIKVLTLNLPLTHVLTLYKPVLSR